MKAELRKFFGRAWRRRGRRIRERDCHECVRCGMPDRPPDAQRSALDVAHLDQTPKPDQLESDDNLALLCRRCHRSYDYDSWAPQYRAWLIAERERRADEADAKRPILAYLKEAV